MNTYTKSRNVNHWANARGIYYVTDTLFTRALPLNIKKCVYFFKPSSLYINNVSVNAKATRE